LFPEEREALQLENERNRRILAGELNLIELRPGFFYDPLTGASYDENDLELARQRIQQDADQFNRSFDEEVRQFGLNFDENQRQFDLTLDQRERQFQQTESRLLEDMRRTRALEENMAVADILRNPADFLARAFLQRGVESPLQQITQADLVKSLRDAISSASGGTVTPTG